MSYYNGEKSFVASYYCSGCGLTCKPGIQSCPGCKESPDKSNLVREGKGFRKSWDRHEEEEEN